MLWIELTSFVKILLRQFRLSFSFISQSAIIIGRCKVRVQLYGFA